MIIIMILSFLLMPRLTPRSTLFPYTTLFRSNRAVGETKDSIEAVQNGTLVIEDAGSAFNDINTSINDVTTEIEIIRHDIGYIDRKSTRLNSSHVAISYAVFCLKKKKEHNNRQ